MDIIEHDMKLGTTRKVTFIEAWHSLIGTNYHEKIELTHRLLSNERVGNDRFYFYRKNVGLV